MSNPLNQIIEAKEKEFEEKFVANPQDWWQIDWDYPETAKPSKVKPFLATAQKEAYEAGYVGRGVVEAKIKKAVRKEAIEECLEIIDNGLECSGEGNDEICEYDVEKIEARIKNLLDNEGK